MCIARDIGKVRFNGFGNVRLKLDSLKKIQIQINIIRTFSNNICTNIVKFDGRELIITSRSEIVNRNTKLLSPYCSLYVTTFHRDYHI